MRKSATLLLWGLLLPFLLPPPAWPQGGVVPPPGQLRAPTESTVVLGSATPVPLAESSRAVAVLPVEHRWLSADSPLDLLRDDSSLFLEQRGAGGAQSDIELRGGSFAETLILLNGFRINDSQTGHHNLDLPIPFEALHSVEVLEGAGSTLHGVDALAGVVDFLTAAPDENSFLVRGGGGSFGENEESVLATGARGKWSGRLAAGRNFSTGFMADRDYRNENGADENWIGSRLGITDLLFAVSDRAFGADQFYGNYPSWERTKGWFASLRQELGRYTTVSGAYRRHTDEFVLLRNDPSVYENNHVDGSWQASLRRSTALRGGSVIQVGLEGDGDSIRSNNLGRHARNRGAGYIDLDLRPAKRRWSLSAGTRLEIFSGGARTVWGPQLSGNLRVTNGLKIRASGGYGFRIPTYTDLYYSDPTTVGNPNLKPESAWSGDGGADWIASSQLKVSVTGFYSRQHDAIDYVRTDPSAHWQATNLSGLHLGGVEAALTWIPARSQTIHLAWTALRGAQGALHGLQSEYVFNYPAENLHADWTLTLGRGVALRNSVQLAQRLQSQVYPVWNAALTRDHGRFRPFVRLANLSNTGYQEISGVNMPGRSITGGLAIYLSR